jgi:hypothetical protein
MPRLAPTQSLLINGVIPELCVYQRSLKTYTVPTDNDPSYQRKQRMREAAGCAFRCDGSPGLCMQERPQAVDDVSHRDSASKRPDSARLFNSVSDLATCINY